MNAVARPVLAGDLIRSECGHALQTNQLMHQFASNADFRADYNKLWDAAVDYQRPCPSASWNEVQDTPCLEGS